MPDEYLIRDDPNFIELRCTPAVCEFFNRHAILFGQTSIKPNHGDNILFTKHGRVEEYTLFSGNFAHPMGAFTYNLTPVHDLSCGRYCSIGANLKIFGERHPIEWVTTSSITYCFRADWNKPNFLRAHSDLMKNQWWPEMPPKAFGNAPTLGHDVWIGTDVTLARDITIGTGAVIGAGSIVTKDIEPYMIVAGNPARYIRLRFDEIICQRLLASCWWNLHPSVLFRFNSHVPVDFLEQIDTVSTEPSPVKGFTWQDALQEIAQLAGC